MRFEIMLAPNAASELRTLRADIRSRVRDGIERHLRHAPTKLSRSRIKRLRGLHRPQYRLRVDEVRVFYDVTETTVEILAILSKHETESWLAREATPTPRGGPREDEG
jgi:mRNA-degrading endonuclease RelE of RelBE toxin-antitoxin system